MNRESAISAVVKDHTAMMNRLYGLEEQYPFLRVHTLGYSVGGRGIPMIRLGEERSGRTVVYVGTHHGTDRITAAVLLCFLEDYCSSLQEKRRLYSINMDYLFRSRLLCIIPMLNPDGVQLHRHGADGFPNSRQLIAMNRGSTDFAHWQANGRGVDLHHNYSAGFAEYKKFEHSCGITGGAASRCGGEYPESEPESGALAAYLRLDPSLRMLFTLHHGGREIFCTSGGICPPHSREKARIFAEMSGCTVAEPVGMASNGTLTDWAIRELQCPAFTVGCGGENASSAQEVYRTYMRMREMLFTAPLTV